VNGGAWLTVDGARVDWILRDLDRVERVWADCLVGQYEVGIQPGHPLGFWSPCYAGEVAFGRVLSDPTGQLAGLQEQTRHYPEPLRRALTDAAWEADFIVAMARKSAATGDILYVALCLSRAIGILAQTVLAHHRVWCLNEKGALAAAATLPDTPVDFRARTEEILAGLGDPRAAVEATAALVADVRRSVEE
jgi:hypothetical protein